MTIYKKSLTSEERFSLRKSKVSKLGLVSAVAGGTLLLADAGGGIIC